MDGDAVNTLPTVAILLITYARTELAVRTVLGIRKHLKYPGPVEWVVADDGSDAEHLAAISEAIGQPHSITNSSRRGVGRSMNLGMTTIFERGIQLVLWMEDDWEMVQDFDLVPMASVLMANEAVGLVRLGYISPPLEADLISGVGRLWWKLRKGPTYTFAGHPSLRHRRFHDAYGHYVEGLTPGETELHMCGKFNNTPGPDILLPTWTGEWGAFGHIGGNSLKDMEPIKGVSL